MDCPAPIASRVDATRERLARVKNFVEELEAVCVDTGPRRFAKDMWKICDIISLSMDEDQTELGEEPSEEEVREFCDRYQRALRHVHKLAFSHLEKPDTLFHPLDLVYPIESQIRRFHSNFSLSLKPYEGNTYVIDAQRDLVNAALSVFSPDQPAPEEADHWHVFLYFPKAEAHSVLLNTIMVSHEILHLEDHHKQIAANLWDKIEVKMASPTVKEAVQEALESPLGPAQNLVIQRRLGDVLKEQSVRTAIVTKCNEVIHHWVGEIVADLLAARLFGPAYFLAFATLSLSLGTMDRYSEKHPSSRMRMALMIDELKELGYLKEHPQLGKVGEAIRFWSSRADQNYPLPKNRIRKLACDAVREAADTIHQQVRDATDSEVYPVNQFIEEVIPLAERLAQGLPPSEVGSPSMGQPARVATLQGVFNAGWLAYLEHLGPLAKLMNVDLKEHRPKVVDKLNQLLRKSLEILTYFDLRSKA